MLGQKVKITVIERSTKEELLKKQGLLTAAGIVPCDLFTDGQEIIYRIGDRGPTGFCEWVWSDILKDILFVASRYFYSPVEKRAEIPAHIACCTDGTRPVIFKLEAISDKE